MASCFSCHHLFSLSKETKVADLIANIIAFSPPPNKNYKILEDVKFKERGTCYTKVNFKHLEFEDVKYPFIEKECHLLQKCSTKKKIVLLHIINTSIEKEDKITIIFSHGNASDLGVIYPFLLDLSLQLKCDVLSYDYSGYGCSEGSPSEKEIYTDIEQVMDFAIHSLRIKQESIILIGNSIGSVPSVHIAVHPNYLNIKGIILISPIASGIKLINPKLSLKLEDLEKLDVFCNLSKVENIRCPVFLIHGLLDDVIPHIQSLEMVNKIKYVYEWFPNRGTHSNITTQYRSKFYAKIKLFLEHLNYFRKNETKIESSFDDESIEERKKISLNENRKKIKNIKCEENYIKCEKKIEKGENSAPIESNYIQFINLVTIIEQNGTTFSNKEIQQSPEANCLSVDKINFFDYSSNNNENFLVTKSVENEGEYIFSSRVSECYYNYKDAKELEQQFNLIQKNVMN